MRAEQWLRVAVVCVLCVAVFAGCRRKKPMSTSGDMLAPTEVMPGDVGMTGERFGEGQRITDPEAQIETVKFAYDSYSVEQGEMAKVEKAAAFMKKYPEVRLIAEGNCDERGSNEYNLSLGENRALAVRSHLVNLGIEAERVQTRSYGEEKPAVAGAGEEAWRLNRRCEFALFQK